MIRCEEKYPEAPPIVKFRTKINIGCANKATGEVDPAKLEVLKNWKQDCTIENIILSLFNEMSGASNKKLSQPSEGSTY